MFIMFLQLYILLRLFSPNALFKFSNVQSISATLGFSDIFCYEYFSIFLVQLLDSQSQYTTQGCDYYVVC